MTTAVAPTGDAPTTVEAEHLARGMAVIRILLGLVFFLDGLAKVFELHRVHIGPYFANLIDKADAKFILRTEVNHNAHTHLPLLQRIANHVVLPNWGAFQWALTAVEVTAGVLLLLGLFSRLGALIALGPTLVLFYVYLANDRWVFEQPLELVPLVVLALVRSGLVWGVDSRQPLRRWPL